MRRETVRLARELIEAVLKPDRDRRPLVRIALELEEEINSESTEGECPKDEGDDSETRYGLLELD